MVELTLHDMAHGGSAIGRHDKRLVFVPYAIPGETVRARVMRSAKGVDFAQGEVLLDASADRVDAPCPHFGPGRCWGCQWQHIAYDAQRLLKYDVLADQLSRLGKFDDPTLEAAMRPTLASPEPWGYLHHLTFSRLPDGRLGLPRAEGRQLEAIEVCYLLHPDLMTLYEQLDLDFPQMEQLTLALGDDAQTMLTLHLSAEEAPELSADFATSVNLILPDHEPMNLVGDSSLTYTIAERPFRVTVGAFFRANVAQIEPLIGEVLRALKLDALPGQSVLDLYAGVGLFSAFIAPRAELVTLVESYPPAATDADVNLDAFDNVDIVEGSVEAVLADLREAEATYDAAVVDPPASGLSAAALRDLIALVPERIAYVSSDPATLARDGRKLSAAGYRLTRVQPIDSAPQTYFIDAVATFEKNP